MSVGSAFSFSGLGGKGPVFPVKAGIQSHLLTATFLILLRVWIPACAGMTGWEWDLACAGMTGWEWDLATRKDFAQALHAIHSR